MTKRDIALALVKAHDYSYQSSEQIVNLIFESIVQNIPNGPVTILDFGKWVVTQIERNARDFKNQKPLKIKTNIVKFIPSKKLKKRMNTDIYFDR